MQFKCMTSALIEGLQTATKALSARTTNPILEGVLIEAFGEELQLICSDERLTIATRIPAQIIEPGRGVVPGKLFNEFIRRLQGSEVAVTMNRAHQFNLKCLGSVSNIAGQEADLFPRLPQVNDEHEILLPQGMLRDMIQKTEFAIAVEDMREVLTGSYLEIENGEASMVGLDGYRLALRRAKCADLEAKVSAIIPGRALGDIGKLLGDGDEAFAGLSFDGNRLHIRLDKTDIYVLLVEGEYIQYRRIIPSQFTTHVVLELETFRKCLDRASLMAREGSNNLILLRIDEGRMFIESQSQMGDVHEEMDVEQTGAGLNIAFNVKYLTDVVRSIDDEYAEFCFNNGVSPCVITPKGDMNYLHLVLPVRTQA